MKILVTGGSGFIGTNLVEKFKSDGEYVFNLDMLPPRNPHHLDCWKEVDLLDSLTLRRVLQEIKPDAILHLAARTDLNGKSIADYAANTTGVRNLIEAIEGLPGLKRVIFASSRLVCKIGYQPHDEFDYCPSTPYGASKVEGEKIVRESKEKISCPWMIVRPTSIWGPWFDVPYKNFFLAISKGRYFHTGNVKTFKSFGFVGNTVYQLCSLLNADLENLSGKTIYLADYPPIEVSELANTIQQYEKAKPIRSVPLVVMRTLAAVGDSFKFLGYEEPPLTSFRLDNLLTPMVHDLTPLEVIVGKLPFTMTQGVQITVDWLRKQGEIA